MTPSPPSVAHSRRAPFGLAAVVLAVAAAIAIGAWGWQTSRTPSVPSIPIRAEEPEPPPPDSSYVIARENLEITRQALAKRLTSATDAAERQKIIAEAHAVFADGISRHLAPWWKDTPWDFNGTTQTPGQGKIACGYYVSTLLLHAGLKVERIRMAQQASLHIIQSLVGKDALVKGHSLPLQQFVDRIKICGAGLYVVGLDNHTGFIWNDGTDVWFLHSSFAGKRCVVRERANQSDVLGASKYRVAGYLSGNADLMESWLAARDVPTKLPSA